MKCLLSLIGFFCVLSCTAAASAEETRCGWYDNPTPNDVSLTDRENTWTITSQGHAGGGITGDLPELHFKNAQWVAQGNGSYGHGCACLTDTFNHDNAEAVTITSGKVRPLAACRKDTSLKEPE